MADNVTLHDLVEALANAVVEAQDRVERYQTSNVQRYFDENNRPRRIGIVVPSIRSDAEPGDEDLLPVPLLALVNATRLAIKEVEVSMNVRLGSLTELTELTDPAEKAPETGNHNGQETGSKGRGWSRRPVEKALMLDLGAPRALDSAPHAKVTLRVESQEPTEGMTRLLMELNKRIGISAQRPPRTE